MEDILRKHNYAVIVCDCRSDPKQEKEAVEFLLHRRVDGLINMATDPSGAHLRAALSAGVPVLLVDRLIDRYSNPGDLILDPFGGIMTVPTEAVKKGRRGVGIELNADYFRDGLGYLREADAERDVPTLFDLLPVG